MAKATQFTKDRTKIRMASETQALSFYYLVLAQLSLVNFVHLQVLGASLLDQWLRISLAMQGILVQSLVQEDPIYHGAAEPMHPNCQSPSTLEPMLRHKERPRQ